ncbi:hypothetical protein Tco_0078988 [Tanacetum coccineum]
MEYKMKRNYPAAKGTIIFDSNITTMTSPYNFRVKLVRVGHLASLLSQVLNGALDSNVKSTLVFRVDNKYLANDI